MKFFKYLAVLFFGVIHISGSSFFSDSLPQSNSVGISNKCIIIMIMEDVILRIETCDPCNLISHIDIYDTNGRHIFAKEGCYASVCAINLSRLVLGEYFVIVKTDNGSQFSNLVTVN